MFQQIADWFNETFKDLTVTQVKMVLTIAIIIAMLIIKRLVIRSIIALQSNLSARYTWRKVATYFIYTIGILAVAFVWANQVESLATFLGLLSAGLAFAFKDPIANVAGWYFLVSQQPFKVGDRVQVDDNIGDVIDINIFQFTLVEVGNWVKSDQSTGRIIHIPNARIFVTSTANYNTGLDYIWNEMPITITFESDWRKAKEILKVLLDKKAPKISDQAKRDLEASTGKYLIYYSKLTPIVYTSVETDGVLLTMRYLCEPKQRRNTEETLWEGVLDQFNEHGDIDFAYITRRTLGTAPQIPAAGIAPNRGTVAGAADDEADAD